MPRALVAVALLLAARPPATAQTAMAVRSVLVSVSDARGGPIAGLSVGDFLLDVDGVPVDAVNARAARYPLVLVVDTGAAAREFVTSFRAPLQQLAERTTLTPMALLTFGDTPVVSVKFTPDARRLTRGIDNLFARPETASYLLDGLHRVAEEVARLEARLADAVVVVAPSFDASRRDPARIVRELAERGVRVHVVAQRPQVLGNMPTPGPRSSRTVSAADGLLYSAREQAAVLNEVATATGGSFQQVDLRSGLDGALQRIHEGHLGQYVVDYVPPPGSGRPDGLRLKVNVPGARVSAMPLSSSGG